MTDTTHLAALLEEYDEIIGIIETSGLPMEQMQVPDGDRIILHNRIIEEVERLGYTVRSRAEGLWIAQQIV
jgi:hypothetical protein